MNSPQPLSPHEIERARELLRRAILRGGLHRFVRSAWPFVEPGVPFSDGPHIALICAHLEAVSRGEIDNLIINQPPGTSKSSIVSVIWPIWDWLVCAPADRFMFATFDDSLAVRDSEKSRNLLNSTWFRILFGDLCGHKPGTCTHPVLLHSSADKSRDRSDTHGVWYNASGGFRFSTTVQSKALGWHAHKQVIDDPLKPQDILGGSGADARNALARVIQWFGGTMATRKADPRNFRRVIVMQRLHDGDLVGHLLRTQREKWVHLNLPMEYNPDKPYRSRWGNDWRTEKGELLCPGRFPPEAVEQMKRDMGPFLFSAQANQEPVPEGGNLIETDWIQYHDFDGAELERMGAIGVHSWDCAFKDLKSSDSVGGGVLYYLPSNDSYYLVEVINEKLSFVATLAAVEAWHNRDTSITDKLIEDKANGPAVMSALESAIPGIIPVTPLGSKESRVIACTPVFARKGFFLRRGQEWTEEAFNQLTRFPKYGPDDIVDVITQALGYFLQNSGGAWLRYMGVQYKFSGGAKRERTNKLGKNR